MLSMLLYCFQLAEPDVPHTVWQVIAFSFKENPSKVNLFPNALQNLISQTLTFPTSNLSTYRKLMQN